MLYGLLSKTLDEILILKNNEKTNHRLKIFLNSSLGVKFMKKLTNKEHNFHKDAINKILELDMIKSVILGMSNIRQLNKNLKYVSI